MRAALAEALSRGLGILVGSLICAPAVLLPYGPRRLYGRGLALLAHLPYRAFGVLSRYILRALGMTAKDVLDA